MQTLRAIYWACLLFIGCNGIMLLLLYWWIHSGPTRRLQ